MPKLLADRAHNHPRPCGKVPLIVPWIPANVHWSAMRFAGELKTVDPSGAFELDALDFRTPIEAFCELVARPT